MALWDQAPLADQALLWLLCRPWGLVCLSAQDHPADQAVQRCQGYLLGLGSRVGLLDQQRLADLWFQAHQWHPYRPWDQASLSAQVNLLGLLGLWRLAGLAVQGCRRSAGYRSSQAGRSGSG